MQSADDSFTRNPGGISRCGKALILSIAPSMPDGEKMQRLQVASVDAGKASRLTIG